MHNISARFIVQICDALLRHCPKLKHIKYIILHFSIHLRILSNQSVSKERFTALLKILVVVLSLYFELEIMKGGKPVYMRVGWKKVSPPFRVTLCNVIKESSS